MENRFCQSCAMPLGETDELLGTEKDGTKNPEYCMYCYANGAFTSDCTMDEMISFCVKPMVDNCPGMTEAQAEETLKEVIPKLNRWQKA